MKLHDVDTTQRLCSKTCPISDRTCKCHLPRNAGSAIRRSRNHIAARCSAGPVHSTSQAGFTVLPSPFAKPINTRSPATPLNPAISYYNKTLMAETPQSVAHALLKPGFAEADTESAVQVVTSEAVTAQDTFNAAQLNMISSKEGTISQAGRWERWAAAAPGQTKGDLVGSGEVLYVFQPGSPPGEDVATALTGHVLLADDATPVTMVDVVNNKQATAATERRSTNTFKVTDEFMQPRLPSASEVSNNRAANMRLLAGNGHGFAMVAAYLPQELFGHQEQQQQQQQQQGGSAGSPKMPFVANLYVKHPSATPGLGHRWGFNIQYKPDNTLQHVHHTSMGIVKFRDMESGMKPGVHKPELLTPLKLPNSIDAFMAEHQGLTGTAIEFTYDDNWQLQRRTMDSCTYRSSGDSLESWYSSGGYSKVPQDVGAYVKAGKPVVVEAGAIVPDRRNNKAEYITRWLLRYKSTNGQIESARIEVYKL